MERVWFEIADGKKQKRFFGKDGYVDGGVFVRRLERRGVGNV